jgi:hypothetical protein
MPHKGEALAESMIGNSFLFNGLEHKIKRIDRDGRMCEVHTDRTVIRCIPKDLHTRFLPIHDEESERMESTAIQKVILQNQSTLSTIEETLLATIKKVQDDPKYIPQAKSIDELSRRMIDIQKLKVSMVKVVSDAKRGK